MSVWDKLWEGGPTNAITYVDPVGSQNAISSIAWLKLVKAEGDNLQEQNQSWQGVYDKLHDERAKAEQKLEAIRNTLCPINMDVSPYEIINRIRGVLEK